jgi:hypothetical protein
VQHTERTRQSKGDGAAGGGEDEEVRIHESSGNNSRSTFAIAGESTQIAKVSAICKPLIT